MEQLKAMKEALISCASSQIHGNMENVDAKELGEVVDMIKDIDEALYYCTITKAMEEKYEGGQPQQQMYYPYVQPMYYGGGQGGNSSYYTPYPYMREYPEHMRDMDRMDGRMYYPGDRGGNAMPNRMMGRSGMSRRTYMESKQTHQDMKKQMEDLDRYMKELSEDITEMIADSTPEEKLMLKNKLTTLASKM